MRINPLKYNEEHHVKTNNYFWLFLSLVVMIFFPAPAVLFPGYSDLIFKVGFTFVIFLGVYTVTQTKSELYIGSVFGLLTIGGFWINQSLSEGHFGLNCFQIISGLLYFVFIGYEISRQLLKSKDQVNLNLVYGAIVVYLIIGIVGGQCCIFLDVILPGSFFDLYSPKNAYQYYYFSFVTLSTLGYGDIVPTNQSAQALSLLIAISGQIYLTIIIAIIIGKFLKDK